MIADDDRIDGRYLEVHQGILTLLALQAPVASDLRLIAALLHVIKHVERMGDQCVNIAKLVPLAGHEPPADDEMLAKIARMGEQARVSSSSSASSPSSGATPSSPRTSSARTTRSTSSTASASAARSRSATTPTAASGRCTMMLIARCLERIGDNAVDIGEQIAFVVTGLFREFEDASHPTSSQPG